MPAGYTYQWSGEYEFELRAKERLKIILPVVFFVIFMLLYMVFHSVTEATVLIFPTFYAMTGGLILQWLMGYNFSVAVWVGYIALFGIAVETGVVMVVYLHEALDRSAGRRKHRLDMKDIEAAVIEGAVQRLRPKLMTVCAVLASLIPDPLGNRNRLRRHEADCSSDRRRHDYIDRSRADPRSGVLCPDEGTISPAWYVTAEAGGVTEVRGPMTRQLRQELIAEQLDQESKEHAGTRSVFDHWHGRFHTLGRRLLSTSSTR